jgi:CDP-6-deoxy-D-xylo-4-hexulose-3-dehydrase
MKVPLAVVGLEQSDIQKVLEILKSGNLTMGEQVRSFESLMAEYLNAKHFIMVNSGSSANLLMFEYLLRPSNGKPLLEAGQGVLVPSIAWPTTIWPIVQLGLVPIFVDVNRETFDIDLQSAREAIAKSEIPVRAIFPIHPLGYAINPTVLEKFTSEFSLVLINDVCESLGSWSEGKHAGMSGLAASFSFYFSHHITTMEGGGIATNSSEMADDLRSMRSHGWSRDRTDSSQFVKDLSLPDSKFQFLTTGYNVRPTEVQAGIGTNQVAKIDDFVHRRRDLAKRVAEALKDSPIRVMGGIDFSNPESTGSHSWMMIALGVDPGKVSKAQVQNYLESKEIETRPVLTGNFLHQPAMSRVSSYCNNVALTNTNWVADNCFLIGAHHDFSPEQIDYLLKTLKEVKNQVDFGV